MTIQETLSDLGVEYIESGSPHCRPGWIQINCPFCHSLKFHLGYNLDLGYFNCWRCGAKHTVQVLTRLGMPWKQAEEFWKTREKLPTRIKDRKRMGLKEPKGRTELLPPHRLYLEGRGFDPDEIERTWKIEAIGIAARLSWRIYIPVFVDQKKVSWTTRAIGKEVSQRYISAPAEEEAVSIKDTIYGLDYCLHSIVVVEGPTDAWRIGPGAGALFGTAFSTAQVLQLSSIPHRFICLDNSPEAQEKARDLAEQLACFPGETVNLEIDAADPGSASRKEVALIRRLACL